MGSDMPAYLRIVADLRDQIVSGRLPPGARLPGEAELMRRYAVSNTVVKRVRQVLVSEGLAEARRGSGVYVRTDQGRLIRDAHDRTRRGPQTTAPSRPAGTAAGPAATWRFRSGHATAPEHIATRLRLRVGDPVMRTRYLVLAGDVPVQISESWEPLAVTGGTPVEWPEYGQSGVATERGGRLVGVVARMWSIGVPVSHLVEEIEDRPATPQEAAELGLPPVGAGVQHLVRTYFTADDRPVETADIVLPGRRYRLRYRIPIV